MSRGAAPVSPATRGPSPARRRLVARAFVLVGTVVTASTVALFAFVLGSVAVRGARGLWVVLQGVTGVTGAPGSTAGPDAVDPAGLLRAAEGTLVLVTTATALAIPMGVLAGVYLFEFGSHWLGRAVRVGVDVLSETPTVLAGVLVYDVCVVPAGRPSALTGSLALAIVMVPILARTTERLLSRAPNELREASLALGVPRFRFVLGVVVRTAVPGIATAVVLAAARAAGEAAPLLFTTGSRDAAASGAVTSLPVRIFEYALGSRTGENAEAWAASFVILALVFALNALARGLARVSRSALSR